MSLEINYPFTTPGNYEFDSDLIKVENGKVKLKDMRPLDATFYASYENNINANWGNGVLTGTAFGGADVIDGKLDLEYNDIRYVEYDAVQNVDITQQGCIRFLYTPNYNIGMAEELRIFAVRSPASSFNYIYLRQRSGGDLRFELSDNTGLMIEIVGFPNFVLGVTYEIEINWDITNGETKIFIDGNQLGSTSFAIGNMGDVNVLRVGSGRSATAKSNFSISKFLIFSTVQHTANYISDWSNVYASVYSKTNPVVKPESYLLAEGMADFIEIVENFGSDDIKYALNINGINKYWDGANWSNSSGYIQTNTAVEIATNCGVIDFGLGLPIKFVAYFHSEDGNSTSVLDNIQIDYNFFGGQPADTDKCIVYGFIYGTDSIPIENVVVTAKLKNVTDYRNEIQIGQIIHSTKTNCLGYWELELTETDNLEDNIKYNFNFIHKFYNLRIDKNVPGLETKNFAELI